jgi:uracil-DNA glycosylase
MATDPDATDPGTQSSGPDALFDDIKIFLAQEEDLFGDLLLTETPTHTGTSPMPRTPTSADAELFSSAATPVAPITAEPWGAANSVDELNKQICNCMKCALGSTRTKFVFGVGNPRATLMLIGEAPGADEDAQGEPFVGRAGQLLNKILEAINFKREDVYICNILKCRPPNNRKPQPEEVEQCIPYLKKQIALVQPKVILCLGLTAAENLLQTGESLGRLRGRQMQYEGIPLLVTYHPAALLRNPNWKRPTWEDVQALRKLHDELVNGSSGS